MLKYLGLYTLVSTEVQRLFLEFRASSFSVLSTESAERYINLCESHVGAACLQGYLDLTGYVTMIRDPSWVYGVTNTCPPPSSSDI